MLKSLKRFSYWIVAFFILFVISVLFLVATESGLNFVSKAIQFGSLRKVTIGKIEGNWFSGIRIAELTYRNEQFSVVAKRLELVSDNTRNRLAIKKMIIEDVQLNLNFSLKLVDSKQPKIDNRALDFEKLIGSYRKVSSFIRNFAMNKIIITQKLSDEELILENLIFKNEKNSDGQTHAVLELNCQDSRFFIDLEVGEEININWHFKQIKLDLFNSKLCGKLSSTGKVTGKLSNLQSNVTFAINEFSFETYSFERLSGEIFSTPSATNEIKINLQLDQLQLFKSKFSKLAIRGTLTKESLFEPRFRLAAIIDSTKILLAINKEQGLEINGKVIFEKNSPLFITLVIPSFKTLESVFDKKLPIKGKASWETNKLGFLTNLFGWLKQPSGKLIFEYQLMGTLLEPAFEGQLKLCDGSFKVANLNLVPKLEFTVKHAHSSLNYEGASSSGNGVLKFSGKTDFQDAQVIGVINLEGSNFLLVNNKQYRILASPRLTLNFNSSSGKADLSGSVLIPEASLRPLGFSGYNLLPKEIIIAEGLEETNSLALTPNFSADLDLELGEKVNLKVMGFEGNVEGKLKIKEALGEASFMGKLSAKNASYSIYGQSLKIARGELNFVGDSTNPLIDAEVSREIKFKALDSNLEQNSLVGMRIQGLLDNYQVSLFSTAEEIGQDDIFPYLLLGQSIDQLSSNKTQLLFKLASAFSSSGQSNLGSTLEKIRGKLGFSELLITEETTVDSSGDELLLKRLAKSNSLLSTNTVLVLGKYLSRHVYASYSLGLVDQISTLRIKYIINKYFSIRTEGKSLGSGAIDLVYSID